jgi:hypothetical protein
MRNQKWNQHSFRDEEIPETAFEACVFLIHACRHLRNRCEGPLGEAHDIFMDAHDKASKEILREVAA